MIALGIDPSLACTGVATIDVTSGEIVTRRVRTRNAGDSLAARRGRLRAMLSGILAPVPAVLGVTVIEMPMSQKQTGALGERNALTWWLIDQLMARGPVVDVTPSRRALLATGYGRADKKAVKESMRAQHPSVKIADDNEADALAMAVAGAVWLGADYDLNAKQRKAYDAIAWPN